MVTGGIPWYLELINPTYSAEENIKRLCFEKNGILVDEFDFIFHDLFGKRGKICKSIVEALEKGPLEYIEIAENLNYSLSGAFSDYLKDLETSGFIRKDYSWSLKTTEDSKRLYKYRLSDTYVRFYLKYIVPRVAKIKKGAQAVPQWDTIFGLQFENLVLHSRRKVIELLGLKPEEVVADNRYFQHKTSKQPGCQVDYLIRSRYNTLFLCEIKFSKKPIGLEVIEEMQRKIA